VAILLSFVSSYNAVNLDCMLSKCAEVLKVVAVHVKSTHETGDSCPIVASDAVKLPAKFNARFAVAFGHWLLDYNVKVAFTPNKLTVHSVCKRRFITSFRCRRSVTFKTIWFARRGAFPRHIRYLAVAAMVQIHLEASNLNSSICGKSRRRRQIISQ